jgi:hypothetical protein
MEIFRKAVSENCAAYQRVGEAKLHHRSRRAGVQRARQ